MRPIVILQHEAECPPALVARALDDLSVPYEVRRLDQDDPLPAYPEEAAALIILGGSMHVHQGDRYPFLEHEKVYLRSLLKHSFPVWGICLGAQLLALAAGGEVYEDRTPEIGWTSIEKRLADPLLNGTGSPFVAFEWHYQSCKLPPFGQLVAGELDRPQAFRTGGRAWGTQFHPEVDAAVIESWIVDEEKDLERRAPGLPAKLRVETPRRLGPNEVFCRRLTRNFLLTSGLLPADK